MPSNSLASYKYKFLSHWFDSTMVCTRDVRIPWSLNSGDECSTHFGHRSWSVCVENVKGQGRNNPVRPGYTNTGCTLGVTGGNLQSPYCLVSPCARLHVIVNRTPKPMSYWGLSCIKYAKLILVDFKRFYCTYISIHTRLLLVSFQLTAVKLVKFDIVDD